MSPLRYLQNNDHRYMAEILQKRRKTLSYQSVNQSINQNNDIFNHNK